jgi:hypothetical protein
MLGDKRVAKGLGMVAVSRGSCVFAIAPHPADIVHEGEIVTHSFRAGAVSLVDVLVAGLLPGTGRADVAKVSKMVD